MIYWLQLNKNSENAVSLIRKRTCIGYWKRHQEGSFGSSHKVV